MRRGLVLVAALILATPGTAQDQPEITGYELSATAPHFVVSQGPASDLLDDDSFKHFSVQMSLEQDEYAFVFARLWVEPGVVGGVSVGAAVVGAMQETHENLQAPPVEAADLVQLPNTYWLDSKSQGVLLSIEKERIEDFLAVALDPANPIGNYGFSGNPTGTWWLSAAPTLPANESAEQRAWGKPSMWQSVQALPPIGHVSSLVHYTHEQSLHHSYGQVAQSLNAIAALSAFINEYVTANLAIHVVVVNPTTKRIKIKIPVRIRRRSLKQIDDPPLFLQEGLPTWFPTALFSAIHVAEAGSTMRVPVKGPVSNIRLVWACTRCPQAPYLILEQREESFGTALPSFSVPSTIVQDLAEFSLLPMGYLLDEANKPILPTYNWGGPGGIVTYPVLGSSSSKEK